GLSHDGSDCSLTGRGKRRRWVMTIAIRGIRQDSQLTARAAARLEAALASLHVAPISARVTFFDDNGPRGGLGMRCAISVGVPYRPPLPRVDRVAPTSRLAFDGAFASLERQLERYRQRNRDIKRRPKKYFAAKRLLTAGLEKAGAPARAKRRKVG